MTETYLIAAAMLTGMALQAKRDACCLALACGLLASGAVIALHPVSVIPYAGAIDAMVCLVMMDLWLKHRSQRARLIGFIGAGKSFLSLWQYVAGEPGLAYALVINSAFVVQVLIAGGYADALGRWTDRVLSQRLPRAWVQLRDGAR